MKKMFFYTDYSDLLNRSGEAVEVIRPLTDKEVDISDVGVMYKIRFSDGFVAEAYEDELSSFKYAEVINHKAKEYLIKWISENREAIEQSEYYKGWEFTFRAEPNWKGISAEFFFDTFINFTLENAVKREFGCTFDAYQLVK